MTVSSAGTRNIYPAVAFDGLGNGVVVWEGDDGQSRGGSAYDSERPIKVAAYDSARPQVRAVTPARAAFRFRLSEPATVRIAIARRAGGRYRQLGLIRRRADRGANVVRLPRRLRRSLARPGRYRAAIGARDSAGRRARVRRVGFRGLAG